MDSENSATTRAATEVSLEEIVESLSQANAFPVPVDAVIVRQTHISVVFLGGDLVYKVKKPVKLSFLDFSTVELRHHFCEEEVRINRPWAPDVYLGVVPITRDAGGLRFEGTGPVIDWAVKMRRLPESATLRSRLQDGVLELCDLERVARRIAATHQQASCVVADQACEANAQFRRCWSENWEFARTLNADFIEPKVLARLQTLSDEWMQRYEETLSQRAADGRIRDVHGDLRLEHVFLFPDRAIPNDIVVLDGIEFSPSLRRIDVAADVAFMVMELSFVGRRDLAKRFADVYFSETNDVTGYDVLPLFAVYRSAVRAKVAAIVGAEPEIPPADREKALARSRAHWLWCLSELETPDRRPALILVSGLPGTGKSTLSRMLAEAAGFEVLRSDVIRKEIFTTEAATGDAAALYSAESTQQVYDECWTRARSRLLAGGRVIVDATFQREANRQKFLQLAIDCGVRAIWLECTAPADVVRQRLASRHGDASDADWSVYELVRKQWEPASEFTSRFHEIIASDEGADSALTTACSKLQQAGLTNVGENFLSGNQ
ncbi:MAG: AAA family ATPase [Fuerstia sp.]|nr:AAA family ATPase [Fuerstiella sp.]